MIAQIFDAFINGFIYFWWLFIDFKFLNDFQWFQIFFNEFCDFIKFWLFFNDYIFFMIFYWFLKFSIFIDFSWLRKRMALKSTYSFQWKHDAQGPAKESVIIGVRQRSPLLLRSDVGVIYYWCPTKESFNIGVRQRNPLL